MFTVPDQNDATATCPPFSPAGPHPQGFFADCNPGQNFAGTRPMAEHFNELILNLHALLTKASVAPTKGDATMLWRSILNLPVIAQAVTLNVSTSGVAKPVNPWAGDPFDTVGNALAYLYPYWILPAASVTIQIAAGTYTRAVPITVQHPFANRITLLGAGAGATILVFTDCDGLHCYDWALGAIRSLTLRGAGTGTGTPTGLYVRGGGVILDNLTVEQWRGTGIIIDRGAVSINNVLTCNDNGGVGFFGTNHAVVGGLGTGTLAANRNAGDANIVLSATCGTVQSIQTTGGTRGLSVTTGAQIVCASLSIAAVSLATEAVIVTEHSTLAAPATGAVANAWTVAAGQSFQANEMGLILGGTCLATANRPQCSPAINTLGNIDSYIQAT